MNTTYELNNVKRDSDFVMQGKIQKHSPVVEIFSAMVKGEELSRFGKKADEAVTYIKSLGEKADAGDPTAAAELNSIRKFAIEAPLMEEMKLLSIFGSYKNVGFDETIEREVWRHAGERSRIQADNGDVVFGQSYKETYYVPTFTVSGGFAVDYRRIANGDMTHENEGLALVKTDIRNKAIAAIMDKVYKAIKDATGVHYAAEFNGLTKTGVDKVIGQIRRYGRPTVLGDYALISQFVPFVGYAGAINSNTITGVSQKVLDEIAANGIPQLYNGSLLAEIPNPYNEYELNAAGDDYKPLMPAGLGFVVPTGVQSPIATFTRGGLTSLTGNNIQTGRVETRFDLSVGVDVAKGQENRIGVIHDADLD